jgi:hypothetical protein
LVRLAPKGWLNGELVMTDLWWVPLIFIHIYLTPPQWMVHWPGHVCQPTPSQNSPHGGILFQEIEVCYSEHCLKSADLPSAVMMV